MLKMCLASELKGNFFSYGCGHLNEIETQIGSGWGQVTEITYNTGREEAGENCRTRNVMICTLHQMSLR